MSGMFNHHTASTSNTEINSQSIPYFSLSSYVGSLRMAEYSHWLVRFLEVIYLLISEFDMNGFFGVKKEIKRSLIRGQVENGLTDKFL